MSNSSKGDVKLANAGDRLSRLSPFMFLTLRLIIDQTPPFVTLGQPTRLRCSSCGRYCDMDSRSESVTCMLAWPRDECDIRRKACIEHQHALQISVRLVND
jgi:hypothetical protein